MIVQPNARDLVLNHIAGTGRNRAKRLHDALWDLDTRGRVGYTGSASAGPLRPHVELVAVGARVERPSVDCWQSEVAWHTYCQQHGYPNTGAEYIASYPPYPAHSPSRRGGRCGCVTVTYRWATVRDWLEQATAGEQLDLFAGTAS